MRERRRTGRKEVNITVRKHVDGNAYFCRACEISSKGIRLKSTFLGAEAMSAVDIEVPLVEGKLITAIAGRQIWQKNNLEAFEFQNPTRAQRVVLEKLFGGSAH